MSRSRGSRYHMQKLVGIRGFGPAFEAKLRAEGLPVTNLRCWHPNKWSTHEYSIPAFAATCWTARVPYGDDESCLRHWWVKGRGKIPTWDLLCLADVDGAPGLVLVEAKAHRSELNGSRDKSGDANNWNRIQKNMKAALEGLIAEEPTNWGGKHYQLCNRLAWTRKLASEGISVVLVYLGFTGCNCWPESDRIRPGKWADVADDDHVAVLLPDGLKRGPRDSNDPQMWCAYLEWPAKGLGVCHARASTGAAKR